MTFNIRYDNPNDGNNTWELRKKSVVNLIEKYSPEIFGIQEGLKNQVKYLKENLKLYNYIGIGREDGFEKGEYCAIFYDTTQYALLKSSTFWLSDSSEKVSVGWDAALERICTYGLFEQLKTGKKVWIFNTHFDHIGETARQMSARLILNKIETLNTENFPIVLMGDFNSTEENEPIKIISSVFNDAKTESRKEFNGPIGTFNNFDRSYPANECIDFIFVSNLPVKSCSHLTEKRNNDLFISDHFPVFAELIF